MIAGSVMRLPDDSQRPDNFGPKCLLTGLIPGTSFCRCQALSTPERGTSGRGLRWSGFAAGCRFVVLVGQAYERASFAVEEGYLAYFRANG